MKSGFRTLSAIIASLLIFSSIGVSAATTAQLTAPDENGKTIISGTTDAAGEVVTLIVFGDAKTAADLTGSNENGYTNVNDIFTYGEEKTSDPEKKFSFEFYMDGGSGRYKAYVGPADDFTQLVPVKIDYIKASEAAAAAVALNSSLAGFADADALIAYCNNVGGTGLDRGIAKLGFYSDLYDTLYALQPDAAAKTQMEQEVFGLVLDSLRAEAIDSADFTDAAKLFKLCTIKYAMGKNAVFDFEAAIKDINFKNGSVIATELPKLTSSAAFNELAGRLQGAAHTNGRDFEDVLDEQLVLTRILYSNGFGDTKNLVETYTSYSTAGIDNDEWRLIDGVSYASYTKLDEELAKYRSVGTGGGSFGGGGGGGASGGGGKLEPSGGTNSGIGGVIAGSTLPESGNEGGSAVKPLVAGFEDIPQDAWYKNEVSTLVQRGYLAGRGDGKFEPESNITRCEIAKLLTMIGALERTNKAENFDDVGLAHWAYNYIMAAADNGIVTGIGGGKFAPDVNITRQDLAVMLSRVIAAYSADEETEEAAEAPELGFADSGKVAGYAAAAVAELVDLKIINGYEDNTFRPGNYVTRAEAAKLLYGLLDVIG